MPNWYASRDAVKRAAGIDGSAKDDQLDKFIESASREIDQMTNRPAGGFIPFTELRSFSWPQNNGRVSVLFLDRELLSVSALTREGDDATVILAADFFLEPVNLGPPYWRIEIDHSSSAFFASKDTHQRAIRVTGSWGYSDDTDPAGTVRDPTEQNNSQTTLLVSDGSKVGVGDTLLIGTEQEFVSARAWAAEENADLLDDASVTASVTNTSITVDDGSRYTQGEVIRLDSEEMFIASISGQVLNVTRAYNGTTLAAHSNDAPISVNRTLTVTRAQNGSAAAVHTIAAAITKYAPTPDVVALCAAKAIASFQMEQGNWMGESVGTGESAVESKQSSLMKMAMAFKRMYLIRQTGAV